MKFDSTQERDQEKKAPQRGIYLLPNLFTTAALFAGFYAIVAAMKFHFDTAAIGILIAMIADGLDGRVARLTNTQSSFGAQYDSLSDMVAFGLAPGLVLYSWGLFTLGKLGWFVAFLYTAATALRLARFNIQVSDKQYFKGLPCPAAAGLVASTVWIGDKYGFNNGFLIILLAGLTIVLAAMMVSTVRYSSFKSIDFKGHVPFITIVFAVLIIAAIALEPAEMLFLLFFTYLISGPMLTLWQWRKLKKLRYSENNKPEKNIVEKK